MYSLRYITLANFLKILPPKRVRQQYQVDRHPYYLQDIEELSDEAHQWLLWIIILLRQPEQIADYLQAIKVVDTFKDMFAPSPPAYHHDITCSALTAPYFNIALPKGIGGNVENTEICRSTYHARKKPSSCFFNNIAQVGLSVDCIYRHAGKMRNLCPECAHVLYGYENCSHIFENGRCVKCYWDGKRSEYLKR